MEKFKLQEWKTAFYPLSIILLFHSHSQRDSSFRACLRKDGIPRYLEIHFHMGIENGSDLPHKKWFLNELRKISSNYFLRKRMPVTGFIAGLWNP